MKSIITAVLLATLSASTGALAAPAPDATGLPYEGKVVTVIDAGQYTYIEVAQSKQTIWLAAPAIALKKNTVIRFEDGAEMTNFRSNTLNRTFPSIRFVGRVVPAVEKK